MPSSTSIHKSILDAVAADIQALGLAAYPGGEELDESRIVVLWGVDIQAQGLPAVFVCPAGVKSLVGGTNERDDWSYPVSIFVIDRIDASYTPPMEAAITWREQIERWFANQRLTAVSVVYTCMVDAAPVLDAAFAGQYQLLVQPVLLRFITRERRCRT